MKLIQYKILPINIMKKINFQRSNSQWWVWLPQWHNFMKNIRIYHNPFQQLKI